MVLIVCTYRKACVTLGFPSAETKSQQYVMSWLIQSLAWGWRLQIPKGVSKAERNVSSGV